MDEKKIILDDAAYEVFIEKGYKETNIAEISKRAKISVGSFYKYYESKEEIFLQVYIQENERVRHKVTQAVDWDAEPLQVMEELFEQLMLNMLDNKILLEWDNPKISGKLHQYYVSEDGKNNNSFHQMILLYIQKYLKNAGFDKAEIAEIIKVYQLIYYIDCNVGAEDFAEKTQTLRVLLKYFIQGILSNKKGK
ncbi:MAG: TetR/AcrR family transcriptional regulator [Peptostreptococcaceae bacterium]|nr:TetR/AcrR family transcriptional regulator [Peptostreptococcaceae bacterium]